jgi:hypothetical protein
MVTSIILAILINLPYCNWLYDLRWNWSNGFPLGWLGGGLTYMSTFFHELGHTVFAWFYGYFTLPMFDFKYGGGLAYMVGDQQIPLLLLLYGTIAYGIYRFKEHKALQIALGIIFIFNLGTAFNEDLRYSVIDFMGPAAEPIIAAFLLIRALFDLAPRGWFERFLNALFGFAMIFHALIESYSMLNNSAYRLLYFEQKGSHGFGDFDKIGARFIFIQFDDVVYIWASLCLICLISPFIYYWYTNRSSSQDFYS